MMQIINAAPTQPVPSPWGLAETVHQIADGISIIETANHGGIRLSPARLDLIPASWRLARFGSNASLTSPWFEEDCDWSMVALTFPEYFTEEVIVIAKVVFNSLIAKKLEI